jgi:hypothetical protein
MAKLILKEFRCVEDTDESGGESPYFIIFVGDLTTGNTEVKRIRRESWDNKVDKGELWVVNVPVVSGFNLNPNPTLVLVALLEEDDNMDISNDALNSGLKAFLQGRFKGFKDSGSTIVTSAIANSLRDAFIAWLSLALGNDDNMGVKRLKVNGTPGLQPLLNYFADTGHYRVRFVME